MKILHSLGLWIVVNDTGLTKGKLLSVFHNLHNSLCMCIVAIVACGTTTNTLTSLVSGDIGIALSLPVSFFDEWSDESLNFFNFMNGIVHRIIYQIDLPSQSPVPPPVLYSYSHLQNPPILYNPFTVWCHIFISI